MTAYTQTLDNILMNRAQHKFSNFSCYVLTYMEKNLQKFDERLSHDRMTISFRLFFFSVLGWSHFDEKQFISMPNKNQQTIGWSVNTFNFI